ncbi:MAG: hypothetical protein J0L78_10950 [Planctomycetes bacterium]|nr:hypothetical protein [Planctomycetota bacterium]
MKFNYYNGTYGGGGGTVYNSFQFSLVARVILNRKAYFVPLTGYSSSSDTFGYLSVDDACLVVVPGPPDYATVEGAGSSSILVDTSTTPPTAFRLVVDEFAGSGTIAEFSSTTLVSAKLKVTPVTLGAFYFFNQADSAWGKTVIVPECRTEGAVACPARIEQNPDEIDDFRHDGCTITTLAMIFSALAGKEVTPPDFAAILAKNKGFDNLKAGSPTVSVLNVDVPFPEDSVLAGLRLTFSTVPAASKSDGDVLGAVAASVKNGMPSILNVPDFYDTAEQLVGTSAQPGQAGHYIAAYGLTADATSPPEAQHILIADPGFTATLKVATGKDENAITLQDYFDHIVNSPRSSIESTPSDWFSKGGTFRNRLDNKENKASQISKRARVASFGGAGAVVGWSTDLRPPLSEHSTNSSATGSAAPVTFILTDRLTGVRWFSSEVEAYRWYREPIAVRIYSDPFFRPPSGIKDPAQLSRMLFDPTYYDFNGRRNYFDPYFDRVLESLPNDSISSPLDGLDGRREYSPGGSVVIPPELFGQSVEIEAISDSSQWITCEYLTRSKLRDASGALKAFVPNRTQAPKGTNLGTFVVGMRASGPIRVASCADHAESACPSDFNDDEIVDDRDFALFLAHYSAVEAGPDCLGDLTRDNFVDDQDFIVFIRAFETLFCESRAEIPGA